MTTGNIPDLFIMGDSHTAALDMAIRDEGFSTSLLYINGNYWHAGGFVHDPVAGIALPGNRFIKRRVAQARVEMGGQLFRENEVVLASIGYHLGRLCPAMTRKGFTVDVAAFAANPDASFMSAAMMQAIVTAQRSQLWDMLAAISQECVLLVIAPPILSDDILTWRVAQCVTKALRDRGVMVWDPRDQKGPISQPLPDEWRAADGVHGNMLYGRAVLDHIFPPELAQSA